MDKSFLFITPLTPKRLITPLRILLFEQFIKSLQNQSYKNWEALLIGEEDRVDGNMKYISLKAESKEIKLIFAKEYILNLKTKPDYIIRIDDDDLINPFILERVALLNFDCYSDSHHAFYDLVSSRISLQKRSWFANTVIHKYEHAMILIGEDQIPLIQCDHSKIWHLFYKDKTVIYSERSAPIYLRVLSPTTVTSGIHAINKNIEEKYDDFKLNIVKLRATDDINFKQYNSYLKGFGRWRYLILEDFKGSQTNLKNVWTAFTGRAFKNNIFINIQKLWDRLVG